MYPTQLSAELKKLILFGINSAGSFEPEEVEINIIHRLNNTQRVTVQDFLTWACTNEVEFGEEDIDARYKEFLAAN